MKTVYLTIDDSPSPHMQEKVDFLNSKNIKAVWFCRGDYMEARPEPVLHAIRTGHIIGNHSFSHPKFSDLTLELAFSEIDRTDEIIEKLYSESEIERPYKAFRFPYGDKGDLRYGDLTKQLNKEGAERKNAIQLHLKNLGYTQPKFEKVIHPYHRAQGIFEDIDWRWTFDALEWAIKYENHHTGIHTLGDVLQRMEKDIPELGSELHNSATEEILLIHDHDYTSDIFAQIIQAFSDMNFRFVLPLPQ